MKVRATQIVMAMIEAALCMPGAGGQHARIDQLKHRKMMINNDGVTALGPAGARLQPVVAEVALGARPDRTPPMGLPGFASNLSQALCARRQT